MTDKIIVKAHDGTRLELKPDSSTNLARLLFLNGAFKNVPLCSGMGRCGLCKVRFDTNAPHTQKEERLKLSPEEQEQGWRFSCLHEASAAEIFIPKPKKTVPPQQITIRKKSDSAVKLAIDLGTTSLCWAILENGEVLSSGKELNPQTGLGSEVMSRLAFAAKAENKAILAKLVKDRIREIISDTGSTVDEMVISGNPTMACILTEENLEGLSKAPYALPDKGGNTVVLDEQLPPAYMPTHLAPFVGADITAGMAYLEFRSEKPEPPYLLADLGTNGEFVLCMDENKFLATSVPMGPALEGLGLSCGMTAGPGAISSFSISPSGLMPHFAEPPQEEKEAGITGTGYLSLCAVLMKSGVLDFKGSFAEGKTPLASKLSRNIMSLNGSPTLVLGKDMMLTAADIEEILKVKAAFNLAASTLLNSAELAPSSLKSIFLAGAMGQYVNVNDLITTGFLPSETAGLTKAVGNTSLEGSKILAVSPKARDYVESLPTMTSVINLAGGETFGLKFLERMIFKYVY
ncbi:ASKHA domain-containing protein [Maridesulfovibrio bastinii]|uniref:ASKHA domain-containing protein n=1 Tax=Maridesulfovibrio bastinii TaxID=47157 RepID=UPI000429E69D|nr:ASKHA domain-containing protein [Maridesulfovibrio bastinii]